MILSAAIPSSEITAAMLPADVGQAISPAVANGAGGEHLMALPLRDAREAFERDYLAAQLARFGGNISQAPPISSAWSARRCIARSSSSAFGASARAEDGVET